MLKIIETDGQSRPVRIERRRGKWERDSDVLLVEIALSGGFAVFIEVIAKGWKEIKKLRRQSQFGFSAGQSHRARAAESLGGHAEHGYSESEREREGFALRNFLHGEDCRCRLDNKGAIISPEMS